MGKLRNRIAWRFLKKRMIKIKIDLIKSTRKIKSYRSCFIFIVLNVQNGAPPVLLAMSNQKPNQIWPEWSAAGKTEYRHRHEYCHSQQWSYPQVTIPIQRQNIQFSISTMKTMKREYWRKWMNGSDKNSSWLCYFLNDFIILFATKSAEMTKNGSMPVTP